MIESKQTEEELKECERKFFRALRECPLAITLTSAKDHRYIEINHTFERLTGWSRGEVIGRTPFDIEIWVDPGQRIELVKRVLSGETVRDLQVRARMKNREVWIGLGYAALIEVNGETCMLSLIADIMDIKGAEDAKQAEEVLSRMGRKLLQAHDEERIKLAQELHDYVERLVLLSIDLGRFRQDSPNLVPDTSRQIGDAIRRVEDLVIDIQTLSQRLHSSKLQYLGLAAAAASFCKELSGHKKVEIDFVSEDVPKELPQEVSLCLFHVLQEALQNAVNYSGSRLLQVLLTGRSNELNLTIRDSGIGFEPEEAMKGPGLGLTIMKERLKMVHGELSIESQRGSGTTVHVRVPLDTRLIPQRRVGS
jgi:PAS domain S-box-containing protein